jgi:hypothetical protein
MQDRFAFTARYWGNAAVVCRATEDRPGPIVDQEFGEFETWTQAKSFAARLNEGLEIGPTQAEEIITNSVILASELLGKAGSPEHASDSLRGPVAGRSIHTQFMLAELDLAVTFCRIVRTKPSPHTERMLRNARNALFDAMHFLCHSELAIGELDAIGERLEKLQAAFEEFTT